MKIVHTVPHIDKEASGPSYSVPRLCAAQATEGHDVTLSCLAARGLILGVHTVLHRQWTVFTRFAISPAHTLNLWRSALEVDVVHNHSLWSMVNVAVGWVVPGRGASLVTSPRGTLSAWALGRQRRLKQLLWPLQRRALQRANLLHATSEAEYKDIRAAGLKVPVAIIPNGIDLPDEMVRHERSPTGYRTLLFLGRIHPVKGLENLLQAWAYLQSAYSEWRLVLSGPGEINYLAEVQSLALTLGLERVELSGPVYGAEKSAAYRAADLYVLPSHSENFAMTVAEALAHGIPAVVSHGAPWAGLVEEDCGWWVSNDVPTLQQALEQAMSCNDEQRQNMGRRGRDWMAREFGWPSVAQRMLTSYEWLLRGGAAPAWIRLN